MRSTRDESRVHRVRCARVYISVYIYILVAPCFKNLLRLEAGYPALRCHNLEEEHLLPPRLEKISPGFGLVGIIIRDRNKFSARDKRPATSKQLQSGVRSRRTSCGARAAGSKGRGAAGSATCSRWRTSGARSSSSGSLTGRWTWHSASSRTCAKIRQRRQHQGHRRMKLQDHVRAVVVKEVQLRNPVTQSLRVRCTAAPAPAPAPVALPSTAHCPASGDHPPTSTRPQPTRTAIRAAAARRPTEYGARARRLNAASTNKDCDPSGAPLVGHRLWGQGQGWWHMSCGGIACG